MADVTHLPISSLRAGFQNASLGVPLLVNSRSGFIVYTSPINNGPPSTSVAGTQYGPIVSLLESRTWTPPTESSILCHCCLSREGRSQGRKRDLGALERR
jgi:hypothetical protein